MKNEDRVIFAVMGALVGGAVCVLAMVTLAVLGVPAQFAPLTFPIIFVGAGFGFLRAPQIEAWLDAQR